MIRSPHRNHIMSAAGVLLSCLGCICAAATGCGSSEAECRKARDAAAEAWTAYVGALERARASADATQSEAHRKLSREVELRLSPGAQKVADGRYPRSSEAWARAHTIALNDACAKDAECSSLKRRNGEAQRLITDLDERLPLARAAQAAVRDRADQVSTTAAATLPHPEYPQLQQARALTVAAAEACEDIPPAGETTAPGAAR
jgi:hypothetical protein